MKKVFRDLSGLEFGRLTAMWPCGRVAGGVHWTCTCICGNIHYVRGVYLTSRRTLSCGCGRYEQLRQRSTSHGHTIGRSSTGEYNSYSAAKARCTNPNGARWQRYGGRGIEFRLPPFEEFIAIIGPKPTPRHSIHRINNDGHYEIGNVKWATPEEQRANRSDSR